MLESKKPKGGRVGPQSLEHDAHSCVSVSVRESMSLYLHVLALRVINDHCLHTMLLHLLVFSEAPPNTEQSYTVHDTTQCRHTAVSINPSAQLEEAHSTTIANHQPMIVKHHNSEPISREDVKTNHDDEETSNV